jgi:hypothetical protein
VPRVERVTAACEHAASDRCLRACGPLFGQVPTELVAKIVPAERAVMLRKVSKGARSVLAAAQPAAEGSGERFAGLQDMLSWCRVTVLELSRIALKAANLEALAGALGRCASLERPLLCYGQLGDDGAARLAGCTSLAHPVLHYYQSGDDGAGRLAGCTGAPGFAL